MKKLSKLKNTIETLQIEASNKLSSEPVQYWRGGDWQAQALEKAYSTVLKEIEKLSDSKNKQFEDLPSPGFLNKGIYIDRKNQPHGFGMLKSQTLSIRIEMESNGNTEKLTDSHILNKIWKQMKTLS